MTTESPSQSKPKRALTLTIDDITETRSTGLTMRFDCDADTTARLRRVIRLGADAPLPRYRRLLRWLKRIR